MTAIGSRLDWPSTDTGKWQEKGKFGQVEPWKCRLTGSYFQRSQGAVDRFGAIHILSSTGQFAAQDDSTGSCTPILEYQSGKHYEGRPLPTWSTNCTEDSDSFRRGTSCSSVTCDLSSSFTPVSWTSCDLPPLCDLFCPPQALHSVYETHVINGPYVEVQKIASRHNDDCDQAGISASWTLPRTEYRYSVDPTGIGMLDELRRLPVMEAESSENAQDSYNYDRRVQYRFASADLEASLLQRMEARQRMQDETYEAERCSHVISPEDLVWGSVKHYCGMVLDRETRSLLGTAVLFIAPEAAREQPKSAWVTCVQAVEGRIEVLIKNSRGGIHIAQLLLTSAALGLALFSVNVWQGFLSRFTGPASLPHRLFVDADRGNRIYVIGYEKAWECESAIIADARVRPGRIIDAGKHTIVEIDFTTGQLGGSVVSPASFRGGLVVRADGLLVGVITGELLPRHRRNIDFSPAYNVHALLEEL